MSEEIKPIICHYQEEDALYDAFMPFVQEGGLFIRTKEQYSLGDSVTIHVKLFEEREVYPIDGKVVWVTPKGARGGKPQGIGVQFSGEQSRYVRNKIETFLAGRLNSSNPSDTM